MYVSIVQYFMVAPKRFRFARVLSPKQTDLQVNTSFRLAFSLSFVWLAMHLRWLGGAQIRTRFPRLATQRKSTKVDRQQLYMPEIYEFLQLAGVNLRTDLRIRLAFLRKSGFVNLRRLASPFGQGFKRKIELGIGGLALRLRYHGRALQ